MGRRKKGNPVNGWLVLDKPQGITSNKAVTIVRHLFNAQKAGHAGTLDPLATGVLAIALGEATKTVNAVMGGPKHYEFTIKWGEETTTDDSEGDIINKSLKRPDPQKIINLLPNFQGTILQTPPQFSAIKINGKRAYALARTGESVDLVAREVEIEELSLVATKDDESAVFTVRCGKGTYIRSLARDIGQELGCFGHITALRRTQTGPFNLDMSISLEKLEELSHSAPAQAAILKQLRPIETALDDIPALAIDEHNAARLRQGQAIILKGRDAPILKGPAYAMSGTNIIALGTVSKGEFKPARIFNMDQIDKPPMKI